MKMSMIHEKNIIVIRRTGILHNSTAIKGFLSQVLDITHQNVFGIE